jgi:hypothetical protein
MAAGDIKNVYPASAAFTVTLAALPTSAGLTVGRESTAWNNTSDKVLDVLVSGKITTSASSTAGTQIQVWAYAQLEGTPTYPGGFTGSDAAVTPTTPQGSYLVLLAQITIDSTSAKTYWFGPKSVASRFGGKLPPRFGVYVTQSSGQNLGGAGDNAIWGQGIYENAEQAA